MTKKAFSLSYLPLAETVAKTGMILLAGEVTSRATVDYQKVVRDTIRHIGYDDSSKGAFPSDYTPLPAIPQIHSALKTIDCALFFNGPPRSQASTTRPATCWWLWSSSLLTSPRAFTSTATRRTSGRGTRCVLGPSLLPEGNRPAANTVRRSSFLCLRRRKGRGGQLSG